MNDLTPSIPHSQDAEQALLGALLIAPELLPTITLKPAHFYIHRNGWIYAAMRALYDRGVSLDYVTLSEELERAGQLMELGGPAYLTSLLTATPNAYSAEYYADIIRQHAQRRSDIQTANLLAQGAYSGDLDRARIIELLTENTGNARGSRPIADGLNDFYSLIEERSKHPRDVWGFETSLPDLDKRIGGLQRQQTTMLVGNPGVGKTTLMLQIALHMAQQGHPGGVYELEMDLNPSLYIRLMTMLKHIPSRAMNTGRMDGHWDTFNGGIREMEKLGLHICDDPTLDTMAIRADVARVKALYGIDFAAVDYLNLLTDSDMDNKNDNTTAKAVRFRQICREFNLAGISVQSMNKDGMKAVIPNLADMSGPAELAYGADNVFFLVQDPDLTKKNAYKLLPAKQRHGDQGNAPIELTKPEGKLGFGCITKGR